MTKRFKKSLKQIFPALENLVVHLSLHDAIPKVLAYEFGVTHIILQEHFYKSMSLVFV